MSAAVTDVVDRFRRLTAKEQAAAYIEIETIWRTRQDDGPASNMKTIPLPEEDQ